MIKGIRGAITVEENSVAAIKEATITLLEALVAANHLTQVEVIQVIFSATKDLDAVYPAKFAREIGWIDVPLFCVQEMAVPGSLAMCLRVLLTVTTEQEVVQPVYLRGAAVLRPDLI